MTKNKLYAIAGKAPQYAQKPDSFWPMPDTYIGIEIETEGANKIKVDQKVMRVWKIVDDHSLRNGMEFVLAAPLYGADLKAAIHSFFANVTDYSISTRTSVHIHLNMMDEEGDVDSLRNTLALYCAAEDFFFSVAGEERKWSGYCSPMEDAPIGILSSVLTEPFDEDNVRREFRMKRDNAERYYALNLLSLIKHGTLEFRHFPCTFDENDVFRWVKMVMYLKKGGIAMAADNAEAFSLLSDHFKVEEVLAKYVPEIYKDILNYCSPVRIASKISAIATHAATQQPGRRVYDAKNPGVFANWCAKKGLKEKPTKLQDSYLDSKLQWTVASTSSFSASRANSIVPPAVRPAVDGRDELRARAMRGSMAEVRMLRNDDVNRLAQTHMVTRERILEHICAQVGDRGLMTVQLLQHLIILNDERWEYELERMAEQQREEEEYNRDMQAQMEAAAQPALGTMEDEVVRMVTEDNDPALDPSQSPF